MSSLNKVIIPTNSTNNLPMAIPDFAQMTAKQNGEMWVVPPTGGGETFKLQDTTVKQTTGTSVTQAMSQNAVTNFVKGDVLWSGTLSHNGDVINIDFSQYNKVQFDFYLNGNTYTSYVDLSVTPINNGYHCFCFFPYSSNEVFFIKARITQTKTQVILDGAGLYNLPAWNIVLLDEENYSIKRILGYK